MKFDSNFVNPDEYTKIKSLWYNNLIKKTIKNNQFYPLTHIYNRIKFLLSINYGAQIMSLQESKRICLSIVKYSGTYYIPISRVNEYAFIVTNGANLDKYMGYCNLKNNVVSRNW